MQLMTVSEIAEELEMEASSVRKRIRRHKGFIFTTHKKIKTNGGKQMCLIVDLESFKKTSHPIIYEDMIYYFLLQVGNIKGEKVQRQFKLENRIFDFKIGNILIEYDGDHHRVKKYQKIDAKKDLLAQKSGYRIFRIKKSKELISLFNLLNKSDPPLRK